jgi:protein phosphatase
MPLTFSSEYCPHCGATNGTTWKAILSWANANLAADDALSQLPPPLPTGKFLDSQQRYQLLEPLPPVITAEVEVRVLDHQPLQESRLHASAALNQDSPDQSLASESMSLPAMTALYLNLHQQFPDSLPYLHDAWQQSGLDVLLLDDRSDLPTLSDLKIDQTMPPLQILHWLHQMAQLWAALEPQHCCRSLLELSNLHLDEDHLLYLQRLYLDLPDQPASLAALGKLWQTLLQPQDHDAELVRLCTELADGMINSAAQLNSRIEATATALQPDFPMTPASPLPDDFQIETIPAFVPKLNSDPTLDLQPADLDLTASSPAMSDVASEVTTEIATDEEDRADDAPTVILPMQLISLEDAGRTDIGRQRDHNEDCFSLQTEIKKIENPQSRTIDAKGLYILCDGMGGHASGEVASALAVNTLQQYFAEHWQDHLPSESTIREAIQQANQVIFDQNQQNASAGSGRMGTTLVLLLIHNAQAAVAHVGDSRLYQLSRRRGLQQLTVDHEVGQREIQRGVEPAIAYARPDAYQLTQALGPRDENFLSPDVKLFELNEDGVLLLCSDGLSDNDLLETHWETHLATLLDQSLNLEEGVTQLIELANQYNGHDNITAVAVRFKVRPDLNQLPRS